MSFRMRPIYPHGVYVASGSETTMTEAENLNEAALSKGSGCGCASKAAAASESATTGCCGGGHDHSGQDHHDHHADGKASVRDPVCGMSVDPTISEHRFDYRGE